MRISIGRGNHTIAAIISTGKMNCEPSRVALEKNSNDLKQILLARNVLKKLV